MLRISLEAAAVGGGFGYDPDTAGELLLRNAPTGARTLLHPIPFMIGGLPGTYLTIAQTIDGSPAIVEALGAARGRYLVSAAFALREDAYAAGRELSERVLTSLRVVDPAVNPYAEPKPPLVRVDASSGSPLFMDDIIRFRFPAGWRMHYAGPDPGDPALRLVMLHSSEKQEFAEIRYARYGAQWNATETGPRLTAALKRRFGSYYPDDEQAMNETSPAGAVATRRFSNAQRTGRDYFASSIWTAPTFAHISYAHGPGGSTAARKVMLASFEFVAGATVVGTWLRQGEGITLNEDGTFERFAILAAPTLSSQPSIERGTYKVQGDGITLHSPTRRAPQHCPFSIVGATLTLCATGYQRK
jgi:hypothetical protein